MKCKKIESGIMLHLQHVSPCCKYNSIAAFADSNESIPTTVEEYKNSKVIQNEIELMRLGKNPIGCNECLLNSLGENDAFGEFNNQIQHLQIELTNNCNLACRYCDVRSTTTGMSIYKKMKGDTNLLKYDSSLLKKRHVNVDDIKNINLANDASVTIAGGEIFREVDLLMTALRMLPKNIKLALTSNGTIPIPPYVYEYLKQFNQVHLNISLDSIPKYNDYIRMFANSDSIMQHIKYIMKRQHHITINITCSVSNFTIQHYIDFCELLRSKFNRIPGFIIHTNYVIYPYYLSIYNLPTDKKNKIKENLSIYKNKIQQNKTNDYNSNFELSIIEGCNILINALNNSTNAYVCREQNKELINMKDECIRINSGIDDKMGITPPDNIIKMFEDY